MTYAIKINRFNNITNELIEENANVRKSNSYDNILNYFVKLIDKENDINLDERKEISIVNNENNTTYLKNIIYGDSYGKKYKIKR